MSDDNPQRDGLKRERADDGDNFADVSQRDSKRVADRNGEPAAVSRPLGLMSPGPGLDSDTCASASADTKTSPKIQPGLTAGKDENMFYPETYDKFDPNCLVADGDPQNSKVFSFSSSSSSFFFSVYQFFIEISFYFFFSTTDGRRKDAFHQIHEQGARSVVPALRARAQGVFARWHHGVSRRGGRQDEHQRSVQFGTRVGLERHHGRFQTFVRKDSRCMCPAHHE